MTLYLSYNIELPTEKITCASWSNTDIPVLSAATTKKRITFFQDEGLVIQDHSISKNSITTAMAWHPYEMILAYGMASGHVGIWIDEDSISKEELNHDGKITMIRFNNEGNRIVSADDKGQINVWSFAPLYNLCSYKQTFVIEEILMPHFCYEKMDKEKVPPQEKLSTLFFFTNSGGMLHLADDSNSSPEICKVGGKIKSVLFYEKENAIILITSNYLLVKCIIQFNQQLIPKKVKLSMMSGKADSIRCCWASEGLIAIISGDDIVRFFYLDTDQTYFLSISSHTLLDHTSEEDSFTCIDYNPRKRILIVGGAKGKVYMWKCKSTTNIIPITSEAWEFFIEVETLIPSMTEIKWSNYMGLVHITKGNQHAMLSETILQKKMNNHMKIVQKSQNQIEIITNTNNTYISKKIDLDYNVKGLAIYNHLLLSWTGTTAYIYDVDLATFELNPINNMAVKSNQMTINDDSVIVANQKGIDIYSHEGEIKDSIPMDARYGEIIIFSTIGKYLLICTSNNYYGIYDITRRNLKQVLFYRKFEKNGVNLGEIREAAVNCKGNLIGFLCDNLVNSEMRVPETKFTIFDMEMDTFIDYEISPNRIPTEIVWDYYDSRLFGIQTEYARELSEVKPEIYGNENEQEEGDDMKNWFGSELYVMSYTSENGIHSLETHRIFKDNQGIFGLEMPNVYFISYLTDSVTHSSLFEKKFQFFQGLEKIDENIKTSLIEFTILMACGKLDEAYKIVKNIKNDSIWENMAHICIKTKRLDVLDVCLCNMRFERGIKALRKSKNEKEPEAKLAMVAMHLNMIDEAKKLLKEVNRWDVLIRFYICIGDYDKAIETAKENDRIDLENTYYRIAEHFEHIDKIDEAIKYYKLSNCGSREIPRMLIAKNKFDKLQEDLGDHKTSQLWWASYLEKQGDYDKALSFYAKAKDNANMIRLHLKANRIDNAKKLFEETKDQDGAFLIGNYYEKSNDIKKAITYYGLSGRINHAFRLAKESHLDNDIYALGMKAPKNTQNLIAEYFEQKNEIEKAINLYLLGSNIRKGLNLCLATNQYDKVREISETLEYKEDKETLKALAEYFIEQQQQEKALGLYIRIKDYETAMKLCENYKVKISKETATAILEDLNKEKDNKIKQQLTSRLGKLLMMQGEFELAHDIYVKIENLKKAMKCCIKMGDHTKVIDFAQVCRMPELYIMAANFLQNLEFTNDIIKTIVTFFTKAKAFYNLANYYEFFASIEINENKNMVRAQELYGEAIKSIGKIRENDTKKDDKISELKNKIYVCERYEEIRRKAESNPDDALKVCDELLNVKGRDDILKDKDIYAIMIKIYLGTKDVQSAYKILEVCKNQKKITNIISEKLTRDILAANGKENELELYFK